VYLISRCSFFFIYDLCSISFDHSYYANCCRHTKNPTLMRSLYIMEIADGGDKGPLFKVYCKDDPDLVISSHNPARAWNEVVNHINNTRKAHNSVNSHIASKCTFVTNNLPALYYFGITPPAVVSAIEKLPDVRLCKRYRFQYDMVIRLPKKLIRTCLC